MGGVIRLIDGCGDNSIRRRHRPERITTFRPDLKKYAAASKQKKKSNSKQRQDQLSLLRTLLKSREDRLRKQRPEGDDDSTVLRPRLSLKEEISPQLYSGGNRRTNVRYEDEIKERQRRIRNCLRKRQGLAVSEKNRIFFLPPGKKIFFNAGLGFWRNAGV